MELLFFSENKYEEYFRKYKPDLVFATTILGKVDISFLKIAKKKKIKNIAMAKGWDSVDRRLFRVCPDKLMVFNRVMKETVAKLQDVPEKDIFITGFPQFDIYSRKDLLLPRAEFFKKIGLDPVKKLIFFGSEGLWGRDEEEIAQIMTQLSMMNLARRPHLSFGRIILILKESVSRSLRSINLCIWTTNIVCLIYFSTIGMLVVMK